MLEAPLGLSHPQTSFIGTVCQGIHHTPSQAAQQQNHRPTRGFPDSKDRQTTNLNTKMITKRSISKPNSIEEFGEIAISKKKRSFSFSCSRPLSSSQTTTRHTIRPATRDRPPRMGIEPRHRKPVGWRSGSPKAYPYHSPDGTNPIKPLISSTPASTTTTPTAGAHVAHTVQKHGLYSP